MTSQKRARLGGIPPELTIREWNKGRLVDNLITDSRYSRILGGNLRNNLSWESHLLTGKKAILPAARRLVGSMSGLRQLMSRKANLNLVNALVISKISYN